MPKVHLRQHSAPGFGEPGLDSRQDRSAFSIARRSLPIIQ